MTDKDSTLFADEHGVWREDDPGHPFGIDWDDIESVCGYKLDVITEVYTIIELVHLSGHSLELYAHWPGFSQVVDSITKRLSKITPSWIEDIDKLAVDESAITVWRRD